MTGSPLRTARGRWETCLTHIVRTKERIGGTKTKGPRNFEASRLHEHVWMVLMPVLFARIPMGCFQEGGIAATLGSPIVLKELFLMRYCDKKSGIACMSFMQAEPIQLFHWFRLWMAGIPTADEGTLGRMRKSCGGQAQESCICNKGQLSVTSRSNPVMRIMSCFAHLLLKHTATQHAN